MDQHIKCQAEGGKQTGGRGTSVTNRPKEKNMDQLQCNPRISIQEIGHWGTHVQALICPKF